jgi:hypothetical protein
MHIISAIIYQNKPFYINFVNDINRTIRYMYVLCLMYEIVLLL